MSTSIYSHFGRHLISRLGTGTSSSEIRPSAL